MFADEVKSSVMESIIDTNNISQIVRLRFCRWLGGFADIGPAYGSGKHEIVSNVGFQSQVIRTGLAICLFKVFLISAGCHRESGAQKAPAGMIKSRVTGASMSPTIWGDHAWVTCQGCGIHWRANWQVEMRPQAAVPCWNCGFQIDVAVTDFEVKLGDMIKVDTDAYEGKKTSPASGEVVAIRNSQGIRIKRIVAIEGQTVSVREENLFCDGHRMTSPAPWIEVHHDAFRFEGKSWWQPESQNAAQSAGAQSAAAQFAAAQFAAARPAGWKQTANGFSFSLDGSENPRAMLIYGHRSPYNGLRADRVRDDYACNLAESRLLRDVDELLVTADVEVTQATQLSWWIWREARPVCQSQHLRTGFHRIEMRWDQPNEISLDEPVPVGICPEQPIGLIIQHGSINLSRIAIHRPIVYWVDEKRSSINFPLLLKPGEYFVIGDNVPFSVDSRHHGVVSRGQIVGKVMGHIDVP